ncbi:hypothetical protein Tco_0204362 [Tanacetum coccineum]
MPLNVNNWLYPVHIEIQKIFKDEIASIINQVEVRVIHFEKEFLKEAAKFVQDFKSLAKEVDESLDMIKVLEKENERLLRAIFNQDIISIVQNISVVDTSNLQTELERTKQNFETCIIKKENEYVVLWNNWYKNVRNANMTRFYTMKPTMTCNIKLNGSKLDWEISRERV